MNLSEHQYLRLKAAKPTYDTWKRSRFVSNDETSQHHMGLMQLVAEENCTGWKLDRQCPACIEDMLKKCYEYSDYYKWEAKETAAVMTTPKGKRK